MDVLSQMHEKNLSDGQVVFKEGAEAEWVYIVKRGSAVISTKAASKVAE